MLRYKASPRALLTNSAIISPPPSLRLGSQRERSSGNKKQKHQSPPSAAFSSWLHFCLASPPASSPSLLCSFFRSRVPLRRLLGSPGSAAPGVSAPWGLRAHTALPMPDTRERQAAIRLHAPRRRIGASPFARLAVPTLTHGTLGRPRWRTEEVTE